MRNKNIYPSDSRKIRLSFFVQSIQKYPSFFYLHPFYNIGMINLFFLNSINSLQSLLRIPKTSIASTATLYLYVLPAHVLTQRVFTYYNTKEEYYLPKKPIELERLIFADDGYLNPKMALTDNTFIQQNPGRLLFLFIQKRYP